MSNRNQFFLSCFVVFIVLPIGYLWSFNYSAKKFDGFPPLILSYGKYSGILINQDYHCDKTNIFGNKTEVCQEILNYNTNYGIRESDANNLLKDRQINTLLNMASADRQICISQQSFEIGSANYKINNPVDCLAIDERILQVVKEGKYKPSNGLISGFELQNLWLNQRSEELFNKQIELKQKEVEKILKDAK